MNQNKGYTLTVISSRTHQTLRGKNGVNMEEESFLLYNTVTSSILEMYDLYSPFETKGLICRGYWGKIWSPYSAGKPLQPGQDEAAGSGTTHMRPTASAGRAATLVKHILQTQVHRAWQRPRLGQDLKEDTLCHTTGRVLDKSSSGLK